MARPEHPAAPPGFDMISLIGFGEAATALVHGWRSENLNLSFSAYDIKTVSQSGTVADAKWQDYARAGVRGVGSVSELMAEANLVFSLVTADQAQAVATAASASIAPGTMFLDGNSCAPETKRANARLIKSAGGRYVDMAIMAPVHPQAHKAPVLLSGTEADTAADILSGLGMHATVVGAEIGRASSIKMIRSVMIKGLEALTAECVLSARRAGVEDAVLDSLDKTYPQFGWTEFATYSLERMMLHGQRRAAEMSEAARTVGDLGVKNDMSLATAKWQDMIGCLALDAGDNRFQSRADAILAAIGDTRDEGV